MKPRLDRIDFRPDQCLDVGDLRQASQRSQQLLELHAARAHNVWGVATGYLCSLDQDTVAVGPGVAVDAQGHQLVNSGNVVLPAPASGESGQAQVFDLVARHAETSALRRGCSLTGLPHERPALRWEWAGPPRSAQDDAPRISRRVRLGTDVPIARLTTATANSSAGIDTSQRPVAHGLVRPKIASGHVLQATVPVSGSYANWTMTVPTAVAGFVSDSPAYFVSLDAHPFGDSADLGFTSDAPANAGGPPDVVKRLGWQGPFVAIESKGRSEFSIRVATAAASDWANDTWHGPSTNPVSVSWLGVETPNQPFALTTDWMIFLLNLIPAANGGIE